ncbi:MAG: hypothetical protein AB7I19_13490 [Planctomycetota bacterium]
MSFLAQAFSRSSRSTALVAQLLLLTAFLCGTSTLRAQKPSTDARTGLTFKAPKGWVELPATGDRGCLTALFAAPRSVADKKTSLPHTPILRVMRFASTSELPAEVDGLPRKSPYVSFDDFIARGLVPTGSSVQQNSGKAGKVEGQTFEIQLTLATGNLTLYGVRQSIDGGEVVFGFEVLTDHFEKLKKDFDGTLATLAPGARSDEVSVIPTFVTNPGAWNDMDPSARKKERSTWAEAKTKHVAALANSSFKNSKSKYWTVSSAAEAGFTKKAVAAAEAARAFFLSKMPPFQSDTLPAVLRIFASPDHLAAYDRSRAGAREFEPTTRELLFVQDPDQGGSSAYGALFRAVLWQIIDDHDPTALHALPRWIDNGCWEFCRSTKFDGKKIDFFSSDVEKGRIDYQRRGNSMPALWDLIQESIQPSPKDNGPEENWGYTPECARLVRWCWQDDGQKALGRDHLLADYFHQVGESIREVGFDPNFDVDMARLNDAQRTTVRERGYVWRDKIVTTSSHKLLPDAEVWKRANEAWLKFQEKAD